MPRSLQDRKCTYGEVVIQQGQWEIIAQRTQDINHVVGLYHNEMKQQSVSEK